MNVAEFEQQLGKVPVKPVSFLAFSTLTHQIEYTPEDFIAYMGQGSNGAYSVNKQKTGSTSYKYSVISLTGGWITTVVSDQTQTGGIGMEIPKLPDWAVTVGMHAVSGFALGFLTAFVGSEGQIVDVISAMKGAVIVGVYGACKEVLAYLQTKPSTAAGVVASQNKKLHERML